MKAIETRYNGYRFRSRLEARWAVFLDTLGWRWEYEPEAYGDGKIGYLPDFLLGPWDTKHHAPRFFLEIKPAAGDDFDADKAIAQWTGIANSTGLDLWAAFGPPWEATFLHFQSKRHIVWPGLLFACPCCGGPAHLYSESSATDLRATTAGQKFFDTPAMRTAVSAAKSARFER